MGRGRHPILSASLLCANTLALGEALREIEESDIDYIHIDMADGHFVPLLGIGMEQAKQVRSATKVPLDVHLLVSNPEVLVPRVLEELSPATVVFHVEATHHAVGLAGVIREKGVLAGVAVNPGTPLATLEYILPEIDLVLVMTANPGLIAQRLIPGMLKKLSDLRRIVDERSLDILIEVDGDVSYENAPRLWELGADIFVCGRSVFSSPGGIAPAARELKSTLVA